MSNAATYSTEILNFSEKVRVLLDQSEKNAVLCSSPKRIEFEFCAILAAWEATVCSDSKPRGWLTIWQKHCNKLHKAQAGLTLADPVNGPTFARRWHVPKDERAKAYATVRDGLRRVFKKTLAHYQTPECRTLSNDRDYSCVIRQLALSSFRSASRFACPEGLEAFLLTLIELFEESLGVAKDRLRSHQLWLTEIRRRRLGGQAETRSLADVAPAEVRLRRQDSFSAKERLGILKTMFSAMRRIVKEFQPRLPN